MATRRKEGMSWAEVSDFEGCVEQIRRSALEIAKESKYYINENACMVSGGDTFTNNIKGDVAKIQACMRKINAYSKKYGNL